MPFLPFFLLRTPASPLEKLLPFPAPNELKKNTQLKKAIGLASPSLHQELSSSDPLSDKAYKSALKYLIRMSSRATPYGYFAGVCTGEVGLKTQMELGSPTPHHRIDSSYAQALIAQVETELQSQLTYFSNETIYEKAGRLRYLESTSENFVVSELFPVPKFLHKLLSEAKTGLSFAALLERFEKLGFSNESAHEYLRELIKEQVLFSELRMKPTGNKSVLDELIKVIRHKAPTSLHLSFLKHLKSHYLKSHTLPDFRSFQSSLARIAPEKQTDLCIRTKSCQLSGSVLSVLEPYFQALSQLPLSPPSKQLSDFAERFKERYGKQAVPLLEALDSEWGISTPNTLIPSPLQGLDLDPPTLKEERKDWSSFLLSALEKTTQKQYLPNLSELKLQLSDLGESRNPIPDNYYALGSILCSTQADLDKGNFLFHLRALQGPGLSRLLGRFAHVDTQLKTKLKEAFFESNSTEAVTAEIIHLPAGKAGNVIQRPVLSSYEIACLGQPSVKPAYQIPVSDLLVSINEKGRILLHSKRLKKQIIPRLSCAHNYQTGLSVYSFLAMLAFQQESVQLKGDWPTALQHSFLPRVRFGPLILCRARWLLDAKQPWPANLPRWVCLNLADQELALDLHQLVCRDLLSDELSKKGTLAVYEWLQTPETCWIRNQVKQRFAHEVVLLYENKSCSDSSFPLPALREKVQRFSPGSSYLYVKLYAGEALLEEWLAHELPAFLSQISLIRWFFVRYADPKPHLRLRILFTTPLQAAKALIRLQKALASLVDQDFMTLQIDTYEPEIQRYGGPDLLKDSEDWFFHESEWMIGYLQSQPSAEDRLLVGFRMIETYLQAFDLPLRSKFSLLQKLESRFFSEYENPKLLREQLQKRYRKYLPQLLASLEKADSPLEHWQVKTTPTLEKIKAKADPCELLPHYLHMSINRLFSSHPRQYELMLYCFLNRHYASLLARSST